MPLWKHGTGGRPMIISKKKIDFMLKETEERIRMEHMREMEQRELRRDYYQMSDQLRMDISRLLERINRMEAEMHSRRASNE